MSIKLKLTLDIHYRIQPEDKPSRDCPGNPAFIEIDGAFIDDEEDWDIYEALPEQIKQQIEEKIWEYEAQFPECNIEGL